MKTSCKIIQQRVAQMLLVCLVVGQPMRTAQAASTDIADVPMAVKNSVPPNIMFTLDDSGSMQFEVIPENNAVYMTFPHPAGNVYGSAGYSGSYDMVVDTDATNQYTRYYRSAKFNLLYYNPAKRYMPWTNFDRSLMPAAVETAAYHNPYNTGEGTRNLTVDNTVTANWVYTNGAANVESRTFFPATYFNWVGAGTLSGVNDPQNTSANLVKVEIKPATPTYTIPAGSNRSDCAAFTPAAPSFTCTYAEEIKNFANWYTYYRSRILLARAGVGQAFAQIDDSPRIGFATINTSSATIDTVSSPGTLVSGVRKFDSAGRSSFYDALYGHVMPTEGTPLRQALDDVGKYFERADDKGPWGQFPGTGGGTQAACRQSYNILMTDGYWNEDSARTGAAQDNNDHGDHATTITNHNTSPVPPTYTYSAATPYDDNNNDTLADVAMYYWYRDLRTDLPNKVIPNSLDPAFWQHLVNLTVGLGVTGFETEATIQSAFTGIPSIPSINWGNPNGSGAADVINKRKVDDLAHAAINSRGAYLNAADPNQFAGSLASHINNILARDAGAASVAVSNAYVTGTDSKSYIPEYNSGTWTGDLKAYPINSSTGVPDESSPVWATSAQAQLDAKDWTTRKIASSTDVPGAIGGIRFWLNLGSLWSAGSISMSQFMSLYNPPDKYPLWVLDYLRGDRSHEGGGWRSRAHLLGDIINAEPLSVREPTASYADPGYVTAISPAVPFKTAKAGRTKMVYQAANDGMLHAFNAATGAEEWAYIPNLIISKLVQLTSSAYTHKYFVDATPVSNDVEFNNCSTSAYKASTCTPDWHTILVGGLGKGGRGYYALDITDPTAADEAAVAAKVLWEFPNSITNATKRAEVMLDMGYSFGNPIIVKTPAMGWVVLVTSGYNNGTNVGDSGGDGMGHLYVLNPKTGDLIKDIETTGCAADPLTTPCGLAKINAYVETTSVNNTTERVYGGDLMGNVWRFDVAGFGWNGSAYDYQASRWKVDKITTFKDALGNSQPVTTAPELAKLKIASLAFPMVYIGTGRYLGDTDVASTQTQTMYAFMDLNWNPYTADLRTYLQPATLTPIAACPGCSPPTPPRRQFTNTVNYAFAGGTKYGWYIDLPDSGERVTTDPGLAFGALIFTTNIPSSTLCEPGGSSWMYFVDYKTGGRITNVKDPGATDWWSAERLGNFLSSRAVIIQLNNSGATNGDAVGLVRTSDGRTLAKTGFAGFKAFTGKRVSWREIVK